MKKSILYLLMFAMVFVACSKSDDDDDNNDPQKIGLVGEWKSVGDDMAPLLVNLGFDSIYAKFESNNTYDVTGYAGGAPVSFIGTYVQTKSGTGNIWDITLNQTTPTPVTSVGIFEVFTNTTPFSMKYEVVQTEPSLGVTPPTAAAGFGSTSGGAFGTINIQTYRKIGN
jgi:hypothetical protein